MAYALMLALTLGCRHMGGKYPVPEELASAVSEYNETIRIEEYIPKEHLEKIAKIIEEHAERKYGMRKDEYVVSLRVMTVREEDKSLVFYSYLLGGQKVGEQRTLSGPVTGLQLCELQRPYYIFDVTDRADFKQLMLGHGPRTFRVFIDKKLLRIVTLPRREGLQKRM